MQQTVGLTSPVVNRNPCPDEVIADLQKLYAEQGHGRVNVNRLQCFY
jgi:hypothetical protein